MNKFRLISSLRSTGGNGTFVHAYDQGADDNERLRQMDITEGGWCFGVSITWLKRNRMNLEFWQWLRTDAGAAAIRFLMASSSVRDKLTTSFEDADWAERTDFSMKKVGLAKVAHPKKLQAAATIAALGRDITNGPGKYAACHLYFQAGGGHTVAAIVDGNAVRFMDPNAGEVGFGNKQDFLNWLPVFSRMIGYGTLNRAEVEKYA